MAERPNAWRPAHIHFSIFGPSFLTRLVTQMYFPGDPLIDHDPMCLSITDERARRRLIGAFDFSLTKPEWALGYRFDIDGAPVPDALIEIGQTDGAGAGLFGRLATDRSGSSTFETIRTAHVSVCLFARGLLRHLYTRLYFAGDRTSADDPILRCVPDDRRETLLAQPDPLNRATWSFVIRLQGERETVFFDL